jgi:2-keto-4-pentenoate hydratase/2-oxohepta-3-ene-1,7-dioic acid hydratase in catechol pathway
MTSGTVTGCSASEFLGIPVRDAGPILRSGDVIEFEAKHIGVLRNTVGEPPKQVPGDGYPGDVVRAPGS